MSNLKNFCVLLEKLNYSRKEFERKFDEIYNENQPVESITGGMADTKRPKDFDHDQLMKGTKIEFEHTDDINLAIEIAMDHLMEFPDYYIALDKMENDLKKD